MTPTRRCFLATAALAACVSGLFVADLSAAEPTALLKAGFAETDITPEPGMEKPGGYHKSRMNKTQDPCKVRADVFDDGNKRDALVGIDALNVPRQLVKAARELIRKTCGIEPGAVLIGASHSHSSGPLGMV